jgi:hypothetical protein
VPGLIGISRQRSDPCFGGCPLSIRAAVQRPQLDYTRSRTSLGLCIPHAYVALGSLCCHVLHRCPAAAFRKVGTGWFCHCHFRGVATVCEPTIRVFSQRPEASLPEIIGSLTAATARTDGLCDA